MEDTKKARYARLDTIRGITLCSMIAYHAMWDLVNLFGVNIAWYRGGIGVVWQQSICWTFICLSGFCWPLGRRHLRQGLLVSGAGLLVTAVTVAMGPTEQVFFGVLTLLGAMALLLIPLDKVLRGVPPEIGAAASALAFILLRDVPQGFLGFGTWHLCRLPSFLYRDYLTTFFGFMMKGFYSSDYFPLLPWSMLFLLGYFLSRMLLQKGQNLPEVFRRGVPPLSFLGRHSLLIYMLHQPVIFAVFSLMF